MTAREYIFVCAWIEIIKRQQREEKIYIEMHKKNEI
jgi:hypothetical protein